MSEHQDWEELSEPERARRLLGILAEMAQVDEDVEATERQFLYAFARDHGLEEQEVDAALGREVTTKQGRPAAAVSERVNALYYLASMMQSDGVIAIKEIDVLRRQGLRLGVRPELVSDFIDLALTYKQSQIPAEEVIKRIRVYLN